MTAVAKLRTLAVLEAPSEADTVFGGKTRTWVQAAALWVDLKPERVRERTCTDGPPELLETAEAEARMLASAERGQRLKAGGEPWRITAVTPQRPRPGRMTLHLERRWP